MNKAQEVNSSTSNTPNTSNLLFTDRYTLYKTIFEYGNTMITRGSKVKEVMNATYVYSPNDPFDRFVHRAYDVDYFKKEMIWKLRADKYNTEIMSSAKMWSSVINTDKTFNSNYGQYWFGKQMGLWKAYLELMADKQSRRAIIPMLSDDHIGAGVNDTVCTESINFHIRNNKLEMTVNMRSSDIWFGQGTDCATFAFLYRIMYTMLPYDISVGSITLKATSMHLYERHFDKVEAILKDDETFPLIEMPYGDMTTNMHMIASYGNVPEVLGDLSRWLFDIKS